MQTSTNFHPSMHPYLPPRGSEALTTLHRGGLVLLPTANLWQVVSHPNFSASLQQQLTLCPPSPVNRPELIFSDIDLLKRWVPRLHPKLETLLLYHQRTVTLLVDYVPLAPPEIKDARGRIAVRLIRDSFCHRLSEDLELPLVATLAMAPDADTIPTRFGRIRSDVLRGVDYVVRRRQRDTLDVAPSVIISINEADEIVFLRE